MLVGTALALLANVWWSQPASSHLADIQSGYSKAHAGYVDSLDLEQRLSQIAYRILVSNAELCGDSTRVLGMHTSTPYSSYGWVDADREEYPTVLSIMPGTPAAESGIRVGDRIIEVNGDALPPGPQGLQLFSHWLNDHRDGILNIGVQRGALDEHVSVRPVRACAYEVMLSNEDEENALSQGRRVIVTTGMATWLANDDDLAVVVAHEVAHIAAGHTAHYLGRDMQDVEPEADYLGVYLAARAGYDISGSADLLQRIASRKRGEYHDRYRVPDIARRLQAIEVALTEIRTKRADGEYLRPSAERLLNHDWFVEPRTDTLR